MNATEARRRARAATIRRLAESDVPLPLHASTGASLERDGYAERVGSRWRATDSGRRRAAYIAYHAYVDEVRARVDEADRALARRAHDWLGAHDLLEDLPYQAAGPLRHAIEAVLAGAVVEHGPDLADGWEVHLAQMASAAVDCLRDYDETRALAARAAGSVVVDYRVGDQDPARAAERRRAAAAGAERPDGAADLASYRRSR